MKPKQHPATHPAQWPRLLLMVSILVSSFIIHPSSFAQSASQQLIPFQGRLTNQQGVAYTSGQYSITFNLYTQAVGGSTGWTERHEKVGVTNGMVNVFLGSILAFDKGTTTTADDVDFSTVKYLGITVDVDNNPATADPEMVPRQMIIPSFYSKNSQKLAGNDWSAIIVNGSGAASNDPSTGFLKGSKIAAGSVGTAQLSPNITLNGLNLPTTSTSSLGVISQGGFSLLHTYGTSNLFIGSTTGNFTMTGTNNTIVGPSSFIDNTSGGSNTGMGLLVLRRNTTGSENVAIGQQALYANTSGFSNTALGSFSLLQNITGNFNTAVGRSALEKNLSSSNTAIGYTAMSNNTTGNGNTALGQAALQQNVTGGGNTALGYSALVLSTGINNIALGNGAGSLHVAGDNNIDIGNVGVAGESGVIRIGTQGTQSATYVAGVSSTAISGGYPVAVSTDGRLGKASSEHGVVPVGTILPYGGSTAPAGYLLCNGQAYPRTGQYAALFAVIGVQFGYTDGTNFRVPETRGMFLRGWISDAPSGQQQNWDPGFAVRRRYFHPDPGSATLDTSIGSFQEHELANHTHPLRYQSATLVSGGPGSYSLVSPGLGPVDDGTVAARGGSETRSRNIAVNYIIKY